MKVLRVYDIGHKISTFMMDNMKDIDICVRELAMTFGLNEDQSCLCCIGHIINLIVKAALFGKGISKLEQKLCGTTDKDAFKIWSKRGPIGKIHNICTYINQTDQW